MGALTKATLAERLNHDLGLSKAEAAELIGIFFGEIKRELEEGRHVKLSGFGQFVLRDKPARPGRNPKTGEEVLIEAMRVVTFRSSAKLKARCSVVRESVESSS